MLQRKLLSLLRYNFFFEIIFDASFSSLGIIVVSLTFTEYLFASLN